jgi:hypothetical protein
MCLVTYEMCVNFLSQMWHIHESERIHMALVAEEVVVCFERKIAFGKVAHERPCLRLGKIPVNDSVLLEISGRGEGLLASPVDALDQARSISLVFAHMHF